LNCLVLWLSWFIE